MFEIVETVDVKILILYAKNIKLIIETAIFFSLKILWGKSLFF